MSEKEKFMKLMEELYDFTEKEFSSCPWIKDLNSSKILKELEGEIEEIKQELRNNQKEKLAEESSDAFRDMLLLLFVVSKETGISKDRMLSYIMKKVKWRKPWVENGDKITIKEAVDTWYKKKSEEKIHI